MAYIPKLSPTVGEGLPGFPEREKPAVARSLAFKWDDLVKFNGVSFNFSGQDGIINGIAWNPQGTRLYMAGATNGKIYQYIVGRAFDVSTATASGVVDFLVTGEDTFPEDVNFSDDGLKMYMTGNTTNSIYEYPLTTAFDLSTATTVGVVSFSVAGETTDPQGAAFNTDGTRMYVASGTVNDSIYEYTLTGGFDLSTATAVGVVQFDMTTYNPDPTGVYFNPDGTRMYVTNGGIGAAIASVEQYSLSTGFDVSTADLDSRILIGLDNQDSVTNDVWFNPDGSRMYIAGSANDSIFQYDIA